MATSKTLLSNLSSLLCNGIISLEEYSRMKKRIIKAEAKEASYSEENSLPYRKDSRLETSSSLSSMQLLLLSKRSRSITYFARGHLWPTQYEVEVGEVHISNKCLSEVWGFLWYA